MCDEAEGSRNRLSWIGRCAYLIAQALEGIAPVVGDDVDRRSGRGQHIRSGSRSTPCGERRHVGDSFVQDIAHPPDP